MFYQCSKCQAIYETNKLAEQCCAPKIILLALEDVQACLHHDPLASICYICKGTGLVKKNSNLREIILK